MPGALFLGCGRFADEAPLWLSMFHRPLTRIVYWPFALAAEMCASADDWLRGNLDLLGIGYQLDTWTTLSDHDASELDPDLVDLLFVGGGNTFRLLNQVRSYGFIEQVREFWLGGGDYYGGSAGALLACDSIEIADGHDPNEPGLKDFSALGLLPDVAVLPHFTEEQIEDASRWSQSRHTVVLGLPESVGLRCAGGECAVIGGGVVTLVTERLVERYAAGASFSLESCPRDLPHGRIRMPLTSGDSPPSDPPGGVGPTDGR